MKSAAQETTERKPRTFNVIIVGGGVTGTALAYVLSKFTNVGRIALIEAEDSLGAINTHPRNNSQTLHDGSIETNYTVEKAEKEFQRTGLLRTYLSRYADRETYSIGQKMVIGVGSSECQQIVERFHKTKDIYPGLELLSRDEIWYREPNVVEGRPGSEELCAIAHEEGYTIDFQKLSQSFIQQAEIHHKLVVYKHTKIVSVIEQTSGVHVLTDEFGIQYTADLVVFATGPHSLLFARKLGYAKHLGLLPVAGNFFAAPGKKWLRGKVYTVQVPKLPFAAVHGDPEIFDADTTRFGPTAKVLPMLMRGRYETISEFLQVSVPNWDGVATLAGILADPVMSGYMAKNFLYDVPFIGKYLFLQTARKVVPLLQYSDLVATGFGGVRPQIVNTQLRTLEMGDAQVAGRNILFNVTPSPGASACLANALKDALKLCTFNTKIIFDKKLWESEFGCSYQPSLLGIVTSQQKIVV